jgi:mycothiol synthase
MPAPLRISVARPADWPAVARWTFAHTREPFAGLRADRLVALLVDGEITPGGVLVATRHENAVGGMVVQHLPGGTAVVLLPGGETESVRDALVAATVDRFPAAGIAVAQAFVDPGEDDRAAVLTRHRFRAVTTVISMSLDPAAAPLGPPAQADPSVRLLPYAEVGRATFADTLLATYRDSLDVPEANAGRTADEVLAGYLVGQPDPPDWWLAAGPTGDPLGVVLLSAADGEAVDVTYLGVVPAARQRGIGRRLLRSGIDFSASAGRPLNLSVDERNRPARRLYEMHGFQSLRWQRVFLWNAES